MLDVEVALAEAVASADLIPATSVPAIRDAARVELYDLPLLARHAVDAGNVVIPLVARLRQRVAERAAAAAGHVHWGATSQDILDTALALQLRVAVAHVERALGQSADAAADLARRYAAVPIAGRTLLQQATPTTFGAKAAVWLDGLERVRARLVAAGEAAAVLQLGGAVGTSSSFGPQGETVAAAMGRRLELAVADGPWHTERSRVADLACAFGLVCGALGKIGRDIALLAQTEVGELAEAARDGRGGSSSMPHKRNPVGAARAIAAAVQAPGLVAIMLAAMPQEHERAIGGWQAEWQTLPALAELTMNAASAMADTLAHLVVDEARMLANLGAAGGVASAEGLVAALAPHVGRADAHRLVESVSRRALDEGRSLADGAAGEPGITRHLTGPAIAHALAPTAFIPFARAAVERTLRRWRPDTE
jgi:3-carboxy-cis,cis-muconate cycloisomerase